MDQSIDPSTAELVARLPHAFAETPTRPPVDWRHATDGAVSARGREEAAMTETLANRRIFRSKVDTIRPTYGFDDVSLAPGTDTVDPADIALAQSFCGLPLEIPVLAAAMDAVADVRLAGACGPARRPRRPQPRGCPVPLRRARRDPRPDHRGARRCSSGRPRRGLPRADPRGPDRAPDRGAPRRGVEGRPVGDARDRPQVRPVLRRARRGPVPRPVTGLLGPPPGDGLRAPRPRRLHAVHAHPGGRGHTTTPRRPTS